MPERITSSRAQQREQPEQQVQRREQQQRQQREQPERGQQQEREQRREQQPALPSYRKQPRQQQRSRLPERGICSFGLPNELKKQFPEIAGAIAYTDQVQRLELTALSRKLYGEKKNPDYPLRGIPVSSSVRVAWVRGQPAGLHPGLQ